MKIEMFNKKFEDMKLCAKILAFLFIPAVIVIAVVVTLIRLIKKTKS